VLVFGGDRADLLRGAEQHQRGEHAEHHRQAQCACRFCGKEIYAERFLKQHESIHTREGWSECQHCGKAFARETTKDAHEKTCELNPNPPPKRTVACPRGCAEGINVDTVGETHCIKRHLATHHNVGVSLQARALLSTEHALTIAPPLNAQEFWPCPCHGEQMPAAGTLKSGPCELEPRVLKSQIKKHLKSRHGKSEHEIAALMAALVPIVRT
jgi:hypothetical protein